MERSFPVSTKSKVKSVDPTKTKHFGPSDYKSVIRSWLKHEYLCARTRPCNGLDGIRINNGRMFYKENTIFSYTDFWPIARIINEHTVFIIDGDIHNRVLTQMTKYHLRMVIDHCKAAKKRILYAPYPAASHGTNVDCMVSYINSAINRLRVQKEHRSNRVTFEDQVIMYGSYAGDRQTYVTRKSDLSRLTGHITNLYAYVKYFKLRKSHAALLLNLMDKHQTPKEMAQKNLRSIVCQRLNNIADRRERLRIAKNTKAKQKRKRQKWINEKKFYKEQNWRIRKISEPEDTAEDLCDQPTRLVTLNRRPKNLYT